MTFEEMLQRYAKEHPGMVCEPPAYLLEKQQGEYTVEDFFNTPENMRVELMDGRFIYMEAPSITHQQILADLQFELKQYVKANKGKCTVLTSPNVRLDAADDTVLIPDLVILCDEKMISNKKVLGAPDLIVEVLSKSTQTYDKIDKLKKYKNAGVREYWMIDLKKKCVIVHCFFNDRPATIYGLDERVPVGIYKNQCVVDFGTMIQENARWYVWEEEA